MTPQNYYSVDELDKQTNISKSQLIALAKQRKVRLSIDCAEVKGIFFSFDGTEVTGHGEGLYNGKLLLTEEDSFLLATRKSIRLYGAQIEEPDLAAINQFQYEPKSFELFTHWNPVSQLNESLVNGMFINTSISHDTDSNLKLGMKKFELERENGGMLSPIGINPFDNRFGTIRDVYVDGEEFSFQQAFISSQEVTNIQKHIPTLKPKLADLVQKSDPEYFAKEMDRIVGKALRDHNNPTVNVLWQVLKRDHDKDVDDRIYDRNSIITKMTHTEMEYLSDYDNELPLSKSSFKNRVSNVRKKLGISRSKKKVLMPADNPN